MHYNAELPVELWSHILLCKEADARPLLLVNKAASTAAKHSDKLIGAAIDRLALGVLALPAVNSLQHKNAKLGLRAPRGGRRASKHRPFISVHVDTQGHVDSIHINGWGSHVHITVRGRSEMNWSICVHSSVSRGEHLKDLKDLCRCVANNDLELNVELW